MPRTDLVTQNQNTGQCLSGLEIKLTALPDNTTCDLSADRYGCELVVRPDTIVYLACSLAESLGENIDGFFPDIVISDWSEPNQVLSHVTDIVQCVQRLSQFLEAKQRPFLLQPVWKTQGKSPTLADQCLDVFVWSNAGFCYFITQIANQNPNSNQITRQTRTVIWLFKMLQDIQKYGRFNHSELIDQLSYNTKNDKAFASAGTVTNPYMSSPRLSRPLISKDEIKNIIIGDGQQLLSPERRFDAIIYNSPELFL